MFSAFSSVACYFNVWSNLSVSSSLRCLCWALRVVSSSSLVWDSSPFSSSTSSLSAPPAPSAPTRSLCSFMLPSPANETADRAPEGRRQTFNRYKIQKDLFSAKWTLNWDHLGGVALVGHGADESQRWDWTFLQCGVNPSPLCAGRPVFETHKQPYDRFK